MKWIIRTGRRIPCLRAVALSQEERLSSIDQRRIRAIQYIVSRDYDRAKPLLEGLEDDAPPDDKTSAEVELGWLAQREDDTEAAQTAYERALKLDPQNAAVVDAMARCARARYAPCTWPDAGASAGDGAGLCR